MMSKSKTTTSPPEELYSLLSQDETSNKNVINMDNLGKRVRNKINKEPSFSAYLADNGYDEEPDIWFVADVKNLMRVIEEHHKNCNPHYSEGVIETANFVIDVIRRLS